MIWNGGGFINVSFCDMAFQGPDLATTDAQRLQVLTKAVAEMKFSLAFLLNVALAALPII